MEERSMLAGGRGEMRARFWTCDDIRLAHAVSTFTELTSFSSSGRDDVVRLHVGLRGNYSFDWKPLGTTYHLIGGHHNILYAHPFDMEVYNRTLVLETFGIQFSRDRFLQLAGEGTALLKRFSDQVAAGRNAILSPVWGPIDGGILEVINQIRQCPYEGHMKKLFLTAKSTELLVRAAESCQTASLPQESCLRGPADRERIAAARDLIHERLDSPPTLSEIARQVGINEYKLKRGFKELFHTTVFGYLTEQRLLKARRLLRDSDKTAAEVAFELGYASPQHFNNAFKKKFGIPPGQSVKS